MCRATAGHVAYVGDLPGAGRVVFCGDTLFASGCGRLFEGRRRRCWHRWTSSRPWRHARLLRPRVRAQQRPLCRAWSRQCRSGGVGGAVDILREAGTPTVPTTVAHERAVNPFLRSREPVRQAVRAQGGDVAMTRRLLVRCAAGRTTFVNADGTIRLRAGRGQLTQIASWGKSH
jgi:hydroxyacylglutathione hydrolase